MNIQALLELARTRLKVGSDRALCRELRLNWVMFDRYRKGQGYPSDTTMLRISHAAGITPEAGLLLLNMWRTEGEAATTYRRMWQKLGSKTSPTLQVKNAREHA